MVRSTLRTVAVVSVILGAAAWPAGTRAQGVTPEGAAGLANAIGDGLKLWFPKSADGGPAFEWDGAVKAVPADDRYAVELPNLSITDPDGSKVMVGTIKMQLKPAATGDYEVEVTLPAAMPIFGTDPGSSAQFMIGSQSFTGLWAPRYMSFLTLDAAYGDLRVKPVKGKGEFGLGALNIHVAMAEDSPGRFSGPSTFTLSNLKANDDEGRQVLRIGNAEATAIGKNIDLAKLAAFGEEAQKAAAAPDPAAARRQLAQLRGLIGSASVAVKAANVQILVPEDGTKVGLTQTGLRWSIDGFDQDYATLGFGYDMSGLSIAPAPGPAQFIPDRAEIDIVATRLPNTKLYELMEESLAPLPTAGGKPAEDSDDAEETELADDGSAPAAAGKLLGLLSEAGTEIKVNTLKVNTPVTNGTMTGGAKFDANALFGAAGSFNVVMRGIDSAIKALQPAKGKKPSEDVKQTLAMLNMFQLLGQQGKDAEGKEVRNYAIEIKADGKVLLNGSDMSTVMEGFGK